MAYAASTRAESILSGIILGMALAGLLWPTPTSADTVNIPLTGGTLILKVLSDGYPVDSFLTATGPDFSIGSASGLLGFVGPGCQLAACSPGSLFSPGTSIFGATVGNVIYAGVQEFITDNGGVVGSAFASWSVTAGSILMPPIGDSFTVTEPFLIAVQVKFANCPTCFNSNGTFINATGAGVATFSFAPMAFGPPAWGLTSGVYEILTPEPSTWLLVATGAVGLAWLRWRRARRTPVPSEG